MLAPNLILADAAAEFVPTKSLFDMLVAGGPLMIPIALCSFLLLLITFERLLSLRRKRVVPRLFAERFLLHVREGALDRSEAIERCEAEPSYVARVFAAAIRTGCSPRRFANGASRPSRSSRPCSTRANEPATCCGATSD
jgi:biopolymer transport protein ExbB